MASYPITAHPSTPPSHHRGAIVKIVVIFALLFSGASSLALVTTTTKPNTKQRQQWLDERLRRHELQINHFDDTGRGLQTLEDRKAGDVILSVPRTYVTSPPLLLERYQHLRHVAEKARGTKNELTDGQIMALGVLQLRDEGSSSCICTLPERQYSVSLMPQNVEDCLPPAYQRVVEAMRKYHHELYDGTCQCLAEEGDDDNNEGGEPESKEVGGQSKLRVPTKEEFLWAMASAQSRSFGAAAIVGTEGGANDDMYRIMIPGIDLINHRRGNEADLRYNAENEEYEFRSKVDFASGDEVTFTYGDDADNLTLLLNFGFCIPGNDERVVSFDLDDVLLAAQRTIPNIYPDPIIAMFQSQLREEGKHPSLFAYDGNLRSPRFCLADALKIVQDLGERLAEMPLKGLDEAILKRLLHGRRSELDVSLDRMEKVEVAEDWQPFLSSLVTLVKDEMSTLSE